MSLEEPTDARDRASGAGARDERFDPAARSLEELRARGVLVRAGVHRTADLGEPSLLHERAAVG